MTETTNNDFARAPAYLAMSMTASNSKVMWQLSLAVMNDLGMSSDAIRSYFERNGHADGQGGKMER